MHAVCLDTERHSGKFMIITTTLIQALHYDVCHEARGIRLKEGEGFPCLWHVNLTPLEWYKKPTKVRIMITLDAVLI